MSVSAAARKQGEEVRGTPRTDLVPEMAALVGAGVTITEFGVLDGVSGEEIARATPGEEDERLVTRLRDGSQVVARKTWIQQRLQQSLDRIDLKQPFGCYARRRQQVFEQRAEVSTEPVLDRNAKALFRAVDTFGRHIARGDFLQ